MNHLDNLWATVRGYALNYEACKAGVRSLLERLFLMNIQLNELFNCVPARQRFTISTIVLSVLLLFTHSGNSLLILLGVVLALLIVAGWGLFAFTVGDDSLLDDEDALESVEIGGGQTEGDGPEIERQGSEADTI